MNRPSSSELQSLASRSNSKTGPFAAGATTVRTVLVPRSYVIGNTHNRVVIPTVCPPDLIPGGSSSGSAVAVAAGLADIGLGTDTSGSIRLPAAANGLFGWRPSYGLLDPTGIRPLAPSFDVPGLLTRDFATLRRVMQFLAVYDTPPTFDHPGRG